MLEIVTPIAFFLHIAGGVIGLQLALRLPTFIPSVAAFHGPILIAIYVFTLVLVTAAGGDLVMVLSGGLSGAARLARHLWRMCVALTLATGSALSNGLPRLLPAPYKLPDWTLYLQLVWVLLLFYWLIRVRLPGWPSGTAGCRKLARNLHYRL